MSFLKFFKFSFIALIAVVFFTSCDKTETDLVSTTDSLKNVNLLNNFSNSTTSEHSGEDSLDCFQIVFPVTIVFPDNSELVVNSDDELDDALDAWYQANENTESYPTFKFPITVTLSAGTQQEITTEEDLEELIENCYDYEDCEYFDDYDGEIEDLCFTFNYPVTIAFPDGTTLAADSDTTLENLIEQWYMTHGDEAGDPTLVFPVDITLEDGSVQSITSEDELEEILEDCFDEYEHEYEHDEDDDHDDEYEYEEDCFSLIYPISVLLPDGTTASADSEESLDDIFENYFDNASDTTESYPMLVFPIMVTLDDGTTQEINNEEELDELYDTCHDEEGYDEIEFDDLCFDITYPITIVYPDGTTSVANDDDEAEDLVEQWYDDNGESQGDPTLSFPISITTEDGNTATINNEEELEDAIRTCYHD